VVSPVLQRLPAAREEVRVTVLPPHKVVGPEAVIVGAMVLNADTTTGAEAAVVQVPITWRTV
jgi:hypothetical protein